MLTGVATSKRIGCDVVTDRVRSAAERFAKLITPLVEAERLGAE